MQKIAVKTLVISPNWIGDAVMTLPLIKSLHDKGHVIDVLAPSVVAPIYENCSNVAKVIQHKYPHKKLLLVSRIKLALELKKNNYDCIYILPNSLKSAIIPIVINTKNIIGYKGEFPRKFFLSHAFTSQGKKMPMVEHYHNLAMADISLEGCNLVSNLSEQDKTKLEPKIDLSEDITNSCLDKFNLNNKKYIAIAIGAEYGPAKQWPLEHFSKLIEIIHEKYDDLHIILLGSPKDKPQAQSLVNHDRTINLCGSTSLTEAMHIIKKAQKVLTHDSGLMHIAAAIGTDLLAIYGSTSPHHTPPLAKNAKYMWLQLECSPCFKRTCPLNHYACLNDIKPQQVFENLL
jgi:heptosyltransferase-2